MKEKPFFPLFVDLSEKEVLIIGGGAVAERRALKLADFAGKITVIAPDISPALLKLSSEKSNVVIIKRPFSFDDLKGKDIVLAATNDKELNAETARKCRDLGVLVNDAGDRGLCDFLFPGIVKKDNLVIGVTACGKDHKGAKTAVCQIADLFK